MRTYGRINQINGIGGQWVEITTDSNGFDDNVWLTTLVQTLKLSEGESPFWSSYGIPAVQSITQQVFPDLQVSLMQQAFAPNFASLIINRVQGSFPPVYSVNAQFQPGVVLPFQVAT